MSLPCDKVQRTHVSAFLAGLDAAISIEWGLLDPETGNSFVSYGLVWRQARRIEAFLTDGAVTPGVVDIDLQWMVDRFLAPSVARWSARAATEIAIRRHRLRNVGTDNRLHPPIREECQEAWTRPQ